MTPAKAFHYEQHGKAHAFHKAASEEHTAASQEHDEVADHHSALVDHMTTAGMEKAAECHANLSVNHRQLKKRHANLAKLHADHAADHAAAMEACSKAVETEDLAKLLSQLVQPTQISAITPDNPMFRAVIRPGQRELSEVERPVVASELEKVVGVAAEFQDSD